MRAPGGGIVEGTTSCAVSPTADTGVGSMRGALGAVTGGGVRSRGTAPVPSEGGGGLGGLPFMIVSYRGASSAEPKGPKAIRLFELAALNRFGAGPRVRAGRIHSSKSRAALHGREAPL